MDPEYRLLIDTVSVTVARLTQAELHRDHCQELLDEATHVYIEAKRKKTEAFARLEDYLHALCLGTLKDLKDPIS